MAVDRKKMLGTLDNAIAKTGSATWEQIMAAVIAEGYVIKNWLSEVRGPLQELLADECIGRAPGSGVTIPETYITL